jgi:decaprenylphospho-beta-D-erythro-pentofuranosid-2-ulose 2-reductase
VSKSDLTNIVIFGATSAIAQAVAKVYANRRASLFLIGRDAEKLAVITADLQVRGAAKASYAVSDLRQTGHHPELLGQAERFLGRIDLAVIAHGVLGDQSRAQTDWNEAWGILDANFLSAASLLNQLANYMEDRGRGHIAVIGSVAGDRGRSGNYIYGAAKGGLAVYVEGVRHRLAPKGIQVLLVKPGFVDTPMTAHLPKSPLFASPASVAMSIVSAIDARKSMVYVPWYWRWAMMMIRALPEPIFNRMRI